MIAIREHVISSKNDLPAFFENHPLNHLYGGENALLLSDYLSAIKDAGFKIIKVLNIWETPINYYPYDIHSLQIAIASRIRIKPKIFLLLMSLPGVWFITSKLLEMFDRRPGRLYSFVSIKPYTRPR